MSEVIRLRRQELGLSQTELAARAGTDARAIRRYEAGDVQPSLAVAKAIASALEISLDALAGGVARIEIEGEWFMLWRPITASATPGMIQPVEIRPQGLGFELVVRGASNNLDFFPDGWRVKLRVAGETGYLGTYIVGPLYGALALDNHVDTLVGVWASQPPNRTGGGLGHLALGRTVEHAVSAIINYIEVNKPPGRVWPSGDR